MYFMIDGTQYTCMPDAPGAATYHCVESGGSPTPDPTTTPAPPKSPTPTSTATQDGGAPQAKPTAASTSHVPTSPSKQPSLPVQNPLTMLFAVDRRFYAR